MTDEALDAAAQLWRLAQAQEIIHAVERHRTPPLDADGKVVPSREALDRVKRENPALAERAMRAEK